MLPKNYIGCICIVRLPYYNLKNKQTEFKKRPALVIGSENESFPTDFNILPISKVTDKRRLNNLYDIEIDGVSMGLTVTPSYIRAHKQTIVSNFDLHKDIVCNLKQTHSKLYSEIMRKHKEYSQQLF